MQLIAIILPLWPIIIIWFRSNFNWVIMNALGETIESDIIFHAHRISQPNLSPKETKKEEHIDMLHRTRTVEKMEFHFSWTMFQITMRAHSFRWSSVIYIFCILTAPLDSRVAVILSCTRQWLYDHLYCQRHPWNSCEDTAFVFIW